MSIQPENVAKLNKRFESLGNNRLTVPDDQNLQAADKKNKALSERSFYVHAKDICRDLFHVNERCYWIDFVLSATTAYVCASVYLATSLFSVIGVMAFAVAVVLIYRASMFIHEIVHLPTNKMKGFRRFWNFFAGVPMMVPTFTYESHIHHHNSKHYGTEHDGEYLPFVHGTFWGVAGYLCQIFFQPILVFLRYLIWTPVSFLNPRLRRWTLANASSLVINFKYQNHTRAERHTGEDTFWELLTCLRTWVMIGLVIFGVMPWVRLPKMLLLAMAVLTINHLRTLAAHRYRNHGHSISHLEQFQDSTNITGSWWTELWCPLGLRYHALHHLFPGIPYHNLGQAHRRLVRQLPAGSVYHESVYPNFGSVMRELIAEIAHRKVAGKSFDKSSEQMA